MQSNSPKILGVTFDAALLMHSAAREVATEAGWRLQTLLRARYHFSIPELMHLYKAQILSYIEGSTPALYHAAASVLERIDRVQARFLRQIGVSDVAALVDYRMAPLPSRRDIAMLGMLHRIVMGKAPGAVCALFPVLGAVPEPLSRQRLRHWRPKHTKQLHTDVTFGSRDVMQRSLFGLVHLYNRLPQEVVDSNSIRSFQGKLQSALKIYAGTGADRWQRLFATEWQLMPASQLHSLFTSR